MRLHFDVLPGGMPSWTAVRPYGYILEPDEEGSLRLKATVEVDGAGVKMGTATTIDHIVWNKLVERRNYNWAEAFTLFSDDVQFELYLFGNDRKVEELQCSYFPPWMQIKDRPTNLAINLAYLAIFERTTLAHPLMSAIDAIHDKWDSPTGDKSVLDMLDEKGEELKEWRTAIWNSVKLLEKSLPQFVSWNRYVREDEKDGRKQKFQRQHAFALDPFRSKLQTLPIPDRFFFPISADDLVEGEPQVQFAGETFSDPESAKDHACAFYRVLHRKYTHLVACGGPMSRNLLNLASLLSDTSLKVVLVTGEPGTGKEFFSKAIYYGKHLEELGKRERGAIFKQTTAREIQNAVLPGSGQTVGKILKEKITHSWGRFNIGATPNEPVLLIDELNKAEEWFLAELLRPLEQGKRELECKGDPLFILAASEHIEDLAEKRPRDFWTRISHQLRVVHPLSRVGDTDADRFLSGLFYAEWWRMLQEIIKRPSDGEEDIVRTFLGRVDAQGEFQPSPLCERVRNEFLNTLVPLVSRDELTLRGVRSILSQMFARISWYVRFEKPLNPTHLDPKNDDYAADYANEVARRVNSAVQDVLAILNPARATKAGMSKSGDDEDQ